MESVPQENIQLLVEQAKAGDGAAFGALYETFYRPLYRFIVLRVHNREDAEDMTQTVFSKALESMNRYIECNLFHSWLYRIARNTIIDHYKKKKGAHLEDEEWMTVPDGEPDPETQYGAQELRGQLLGALNRLKPLYRQVLEMRFLQELSVEETARLLNISHDNVRQRQVRALRELREIISQSKIQIEKTG